MALTESTMMALGSPAPSFSLPSTDGEQVTLASFEGKEGLVVMFICNHCPYVIHIAPALAKLAVSTNKKISVLWLLAVTMRLRTQQIALN